jgi:hypothetical protein
MHLPCHEHGREDGGEENRANESIPTVLMEKSGRFPPRILGKMTIVFFHEARNMASMQRVTNAEHAI